MTKPGNRRYLWPLLVTVVIGICSLLIYNGVQKINRSNQRLAQVMETNRELDRENRALHMAVQRLRDDKRAIQRAIRREMDMVRGDEVVYQLDADLKPAAQDAKEDSR